MAGKKGSIPWNKGKTGVQTPYWLGKKRPKETIIKMSNARKGRCPANKGKKRDIPEEIRKKMVDGLRKYYQEHESHMKGKPAWNKGKKMPPPSEEIINKRAEGIRKYHRENPGVFIGRLVWNKGKTMSEEFCKKN